MSKLPESTDLILSQFNSLTHMQAEDCRANNKNKITIIFLFSCISIIISMWMPLIPEMHIDMHTTKSMGLIAVFNKVYCMSSQKFYSMLASGKLKQITRDVI